VLFIDIINMKIAKTILLTQLKLTVIIYWHLCNKHVKIILSVLIYRNMKMGKGKNYA